MNTVQISLLTIAIGALLTVVTVTNVPVTNLLANVANFSTQDLHQCLDAIPNLTETSTFDTTTMRLDSDNSEDVILHFSDTDSCGNAGCRFEACLMTGNTSTHLPIGYFGSELEALGTYTNGLADLKLSGLNTVTLEWNNAQYTIKPY